MSVHKNYLKKEKYGTESDEETFKFLNFDEIFYCGKTRLRNTLLNYCGLCQYVKAIKPKKVVTLSLFKNYLKFQYSIKFFTAT